MLALAFVLFSSTGMIVTSAWDSALTSNLCTSSGGCSLPTISSNPGNPSGPCSTFTAGCAFVVGDHIYDSVNIYDYNTVSGGSGGAYQNTPITGTVTFTLYYETSPTLCATNGNGMSLPGGASKVAGQSSSYTFPSNAPIPPVVVTTSTPYTPSTSGFYISYVTYNGNYNDQDVHAYTSSCEYFSLTSAPSGVPEFSLGSLGFIAMIGMVVPLLLVMRSKFLNMPAI